jgi:hypothetical protein
LLQKSGATHAVVNQDVSDQSDSPTMLKLKDVTFLRNELLQEFNGVFSILFPEFAICFSREDNGVEPWKSGFWHEIESTPLQEGRYGQI